LREKYTPLILDLDELDDWLIPGPVYRVHNVHDYEKYIYVRFYRELIRIGGCLLWRLWRTTNIVKAYVRGDLDEFRKFVKKFARSRDPVKYLLNYLRTRRAMLLGPGREPEL